MKSDETISYEEAVRLQRERSGNAGGPRPFAPLQDASASRGPRFAVEPLSAIRPVLTGSWLIKGLMPAHGLMVIYGPPGCGKSFVGIDASLHVAAGREWAGRKVRQAGVIYVASEGRTGFRKRVFAAKRHHSIPDNTPFGLVTVKPNLGIGTEDRDILIHDIRSECARLGIRPGLVVLDTLARSIEGADESSAKDMGAFVSNADAIAQNLDALVLPIHHTGKAQDRGMRGSSALHGAADAEWEVVSEEAGRSVRIAKMKDGEDELSFMFRLQSVEVGEDEDGDPVTTLVTEILNTPEHAGSKATTRKKLTGQKAEFVKAVAIAVDAMGERVPAGEHVPHNTIGVRKDKLALYTDKLGFTTDKTPEVRRATVNRLVRTLSGDGYIRQWGEWTWLAK